MMPVSSLTKHYPNFPDHPTESNVLPSKFASFVFFVATILFSGAAFLITFQSGGSLDRPLIFLALVMIYVFCIASGSEENLGPILLGCLYLLLLFTPLVAMLLIHQFGSLYSPFMIGRIRIGDQLPFWLSAIEWSVLALIVLWNCDRGWPRVLLLAGGATATLSLFFELGRLPLIPYALAPIAEMKSIEKFIDVRIILGSIFLVLIVSTALVKALSSGYPKIPPVPVFRLPLPDDGFPLMVRMFLTPFIIAINFIVLVACRSLGVAWTLAGVLAVYLARMVIEFAAVVWRMICSKATSALAKHCGILVATIVSMWIAIKLEAPLIDYLRSNDWGASASILLQISILTAGLVGGAMLSSFLIIGDDFSKESFFASIPAVLAITALSGVPLYLISFLGLLQVRLAGFSKIGPYSALLAGVVVVGIGFILRSSRSGSRGYLRVVDGGRE